MISVALLRRPDLHQQPLLIHELKAEKDCLVALVGRAADDVHTVQLHHTPPRLPFVDRSDRNPPLGGALKVTPQQLDGLRTT